MLQESSVQSMFTAVKYCMSNISNASLLLAHISIHTAPTGSYYLSANCLTTTLHITDCTAPFIRIYCVEQSSD